MRRMIVLAGIVVGLGCNQAPSATAEPSAASPLVAAPAGAALDKETARRIVLERLATVAGCYWHSPVKSIGTTWTHSSFSKEDQRCAAALEGAGMIKTGECIDAGCGGCCKRAVVAAGKTEATAINGFKFACGDVESVDIKSVSTIDKRADISFSIKFVRRADMSNVFDSCILEVPGELPVYKWIGVRDDGGAWHAERRTGP